MPQRAERHDRRQPGLPTARIGVRLGGLEATGDRGLDLVLELSLDAALAMIGSGEIVDAKTIMLLQYAKLQGVLT